MSLSFTIRDYLKTRLKLGLGRGRLLSYGQNGEDAVLEALLRKVRRGFYVDVGAYHPVLYSNTFSFYKRGWRGVVIDPNADMEGIFRLMRPRDVFLNAGIGKTPGAAPYYSFSDAAYNTFSLQEAEIRKKNPRLAFRGVREIQLQPLGELLKRQRVSHIDLLNIDVESMDKEVLESHDWTVRPRVIAVESTAFNPDEPHRDPVYAFLRSEGYALRGFAAFTLIFADERLLI